MKAESMKVESQKVESRAEGREAFLISNPNAGRGGERRAREVERFRERLAALGVRTYIECGPGAVLSGLIRKIDREAEVLNVEDAATLAALEKRDVYPH